MSVLNQQAQAFNLIFRYLTVIKVYQKCGGKSRKSAVFMRRDGLVMGIILSAAPLMEAAVQGKS